MSALSRLVLWLLVVSAAACVAVPARGYDMDCKVILCLAGNFPPGCGDARAYMLNRLRSFPPKPPFGHCASEDPSNFRTIRGREFFLPCAGGFRVREQDNYQGSNCCCQCSAEVRSSSAAAVLAERASRSDGGKHPSALVQPPSREEGRDTYRVTYECRRRLKPNWLKVRIRDNSGNWISSDRYWWR